METTIVWSPFCVKNKRKSIWELNNDLCESYRIIQSLKTMYVVAFGRSIQKQVPLSQECTNNLEPDRITKHMQKPIPRVTNTKRLASSFNSRNTYSRYFLWLDLFKDIANWFRACPQPWPPLNTNRLRSSTTTGRWVSRLR